MTKRCSLRSLAEASRPGDQGLVGDEVTAAGDRAGQRMAAHMGAPPLDQQLGAGADEALDAVDHAGRVQGEQPPEDIGGHDVPVGLDGDLAGQHDLVQAAGPDVADGGGDGIAPGRLRDARHEVEGVRGLARRPAARAGVGEHLVVKPVSPAGSAERRPDRRDPGVVAAPAEQHPGHDQAAGGAAVEGQGAERHRTAAGEADIVTGVDGGQDGVDRPDPVGVGEAAGQVDAQGLAPAGQAVGLVVPHDPVLPGGGHEIEVHGPALESAAGDPGGAGDQAERGRRSHRFDARHGGHERDVRSRRNHSQDRGRAVMRRAWR